MARFLVSFLTIALMANPVFSSERKGFILGLDVGPSFSYLHAETTDASFDETHLGVGFDFRIGWALTNQLSIHYNHKGAIFVGDIGKRELSSGQVLLGGILLFLLPFSIGQNNAGIGVTYYFSPQAPSVFLDGQLGFSVYPLEGFLELSGGVGFSLGCGYEFSEHWNVLGSLAVGLSADEKKSSAFSLVLVIGYLLY